MNVGDSIHDDLPARPDEPSHLRDDIADELNDHLASALRRELLKDNDEPAATKRVLARFGNPARIARQLYLAAMKEHLMRDRIMIGMMAATLAMCGLMLLAVWTMMSQANENQEALLAQLVSFRDAHGEAAVPPEWGSLTIQVTDHAGKPIAGRAVEVFAKIYSDEEINLEWTTDADGRIQLDPVRTGGYYYLVSKPADPQAGWEYNGKLLLTPGEHKTFTIREPDATLAQVEFDVTQLTKLLADPSRKPVQFGPVTVPNPDGGTWRRDPYALWMAANGEPVRLYRMDTSSGERSLIEPDQLPSKDNARTWLLPVGRYEWEDDTWTQNGTPTDEAAVVMIPGKAERAFQIQPDTRNRIEPYVKVQLPDHDSTQTN